MAGFNVSFLNSKMRKSAGTDYGFLVDQLSIMEKQLAGDGKLTPGDYQLLNERAAEIRGFPGLTPDQRSNIDVKMADYSSRSKVESINTNKDFNRINGDLDNDRRTATLRVGNDPNLWVTANKDAMLAKLNRLDDVIEQLNMAGDDSSAHMSEYIDTLNKFTDMSNTLTEMDGYTGGEPTSSSVFFLTTNDAGEIVSSEVGRAGSQSGYVETNGVYGGLKVYGKVNKKEGGNNVFFFGGKRFSGADITTPDPNNRLGFRNNPLLSESSVSSSGGLSIGKKGTFDVVQPESVRVQANIPQGHYAEGGDGFLYQNTGNGQYKKFTNADRDALGITDNQVIKVPRVFEDNIARNVTETIDGSKAFIPPVAPQQGPQLPATTPPPAGQTLVPSGGRGRTGGPIDSSPPTSGNVFQRTTRAAGSFLGGLFG